jgi:xylitol oxidase
MNKREFLRMSSALATPVILGPLASAYAATAPSAASSAVPAAGQGAPLTNWAGNLTYSTRRVYEPRTIADVQQLVRDCTRLRALGTRHCFNTIADSPDNLLSTRALTQVDMVNRANNTITVGAGVRYGDFCQGLYEQGYALHNLASLPHISVGGACATATHGSGVKNGNLATSVRAFEFVDGTGQVVTLHRDRDREQFNGAVVHLGSLGVLTRVTLDVLPAFDATQLVYLDLPFGQLEQHFAQIMSAGYSVSLFYDWQTDRINQVWVKDVAKGPATSQPEFFGARPANRNVHPILALSAENCTEQMGVPGPWYERLPHFKLGFTPSNGEELQTEYFVPFDRAVEAIRAVRSLHAELKDLLLITEIRAIAADDLWMSMAYRRASAALHFTWKRDFEGVTRLLPGIERQLAPFAPRPHWGKVFTLAPATLKARYARMGEFDKLTEHFDPQRKLRNRFIARNLFQQA